MGELMRPEAFGSIGAGLRMKHLVLTCLPVLLSCAAPAPQRLGAGPISAICSRVVAPDVPAGAYAQGISGTVLAEALLIDGVLTDIHILSGPKAFHASVITAMSQYKCSNRLDRVVVRQEFQFVVEPSPAP